jgi:hypothetical protein
MRVAGERKGGIVLAIDEGLNNEEHIGGLGRRLINAGIANIVVPLWYQQRIDRQGQRFVVSGSSLSPSSLWPDIGRPVRGTSWPDERVVSMLVAHFSSCDRLCLLTQNTKRDRAGLWATLTREVAPAIEAIKPKHLGLLVLVQSPTMTLPGYVAAVEKRLARFAVSHGFAWELVNT